MNTHIRQNFYQGLNVRPENLNQLQNYSENIGGRIVSDLMGYGILQGLNVAYEDNILTVHSGIAYDHQGQRLFLSDPVEIDLSTYTPKTKNSTETIKLGISLAYQESNPQIDSMGQSVNTVWTAGAKLSIGKTLESSVLELGEVALNTLEIQNFRVTTPMITAFTYPQRMRDLIYPIGYQYTQYPFGVEETFSEEDKPEILFGGDWELVSTELKNNAPEIITNENGTAYKYPDGRLEFKTSYYGFENGTVVTYPIPFVVLPFMTYSWNYHTGENYLQVGYTVWGGTINPTLTSCRVHETGVRIAVSAEGFWKSSNAPLTTEEEKHYMKIWKRIA